MRQCRRRRRLSEDGVGRRGRGETNESERRASERAESWRDEFLILGFTVGRRRIKEKEREKGNDNYIWKPFKDVFQLAAEPFCQLLSHLHLFFFFSFSLPQSIMKRCNLFMGCSGSTCEIV